jgi:hypothetical protein
MSRICLVGAGFISRVHAGARRTLPGHSIAAIVDASAGAAASLAVTMAARHTLRSRGMVAPFNMTDGKRDRGWQPMAGPAVVEARAVEVRVAA